MRGEVGTSTRPTWAGNRNRHRQRKWMKPTPRKRYTEPDRQHRTTPNEIPKPKAEEPHLPKGAYNLSSLSNAVFSQSYCSVLFSCETSAPGLPGNYLYTYITECQQMFKTYSKHLKHLQQLPSDSFGFRISWERYGNLWETVETGQLTSR